MISTALVMEFRVLADKYRATMMSSLNKNIGSRFRDNRYTYEQKISGENVKVRKDKDYHIMGPTNKILLTIRKVLFDHGMDASLATQIALDLHQEHQFRRQDTIDGMDRLVWECIVLELEKEFPDDEFRLQSIPPISPKGRVHYKVIALNCKSGEKVGDENGDESDEVDEEERNTREDWFAENQDDARESNLWDASVEEQVEVGKNHSEQSLVSNQKQSSKKRHEHHTEPTNAKRLKPTTHANDQTPSIESMALQLNQLQNLLGMMTRNIGAKDNINVAPYQQLSTNCSNLNEDFSNIGARSKKSRSSKRSTQ